MTCAFSGGADSTALLLLAAHAPAASVAPSTSTTGLRPESAAEADRGASPWPDGSACRATSSRRRRAAGPTSRPAPAPPARPRCHPAPLTGHTADDRAETMLINLLRGAGLDGLAAMGPAATRPLLALRRSETAGPVRPTGLAPVDDPLQRRPPLRPQPRPGRAAAADGRHRRARRRRRCSRARPSVLADDAELARRRRRRRSTPPTPRPSPPPGRPWPAAPIRAGWLAASDGYPPDRATVERVLGSSPAASTGRARSPAACESNDTASGCASWATAQ